MKIVIGETEAIEPIETIIEDIEMMIIIVKDRGPVNVTTIIEVARAGLTETTKNLETTIAIIIKEARAVNIRDLPTMTTNQDRNSRKTSLFSRVQKERKSKNTKGHL